MATLSWIVFVCLLISHLSLSNADTCTEPYSCESTCYRYNTYKAICGTSECYKSRLEPYICNETCYKKVCCQGYTGNDCQTPLCYGATNCPNGGRCVDPDTCVCLPGYFGPQCKSCGLPPSIQNGQFKLFNTGTNADSVARLECSSGYVQVPDSSPQFELHCDDTGHWSPDDHNVTCQLKVTLPVGTACGTDICTDPFSYCSPILKKCKCVEGYNMIDGICERSCPSGDWGKFGDHCYQFGKIEFSYQEAKNFCDLYDSDIQESSLVQVDTVEELKFIDSYIRTRSIHPLYGYWNDLFQNTTNGVDEYWRSSGDPLVVSDWREGQPNLQGESCTVFYKRYYYKWVDASCANSENPAEIDKITAFALCETKIRRPVDK